MRVTGSFRIEVDKASARGPMSPLQANDVAPAAVF
jgi:hypothetical protein